MLYGIVMFATPYAIRPDELGRAVEERGFESLWVPEHTHIPASRRSPWPGGPNLPKEYWHSYFDLCLVPVIQREARDERAPIQLQPRRP